MIKQSCIFQVASSTVSTVFSHTNSKQELNRPWEGKRGTGQTLSLNAVTWAGGIEEPFSSQESWDSHFRDSGLGPKSQHNKSQSSAQFFHCMMCLCSMCLKLGDWQRSLWNTLMTLQVCPPKSRYRPTRSLSVGLSKLDQIRMLPKENQQSNENFPQNWKNMHKIFNGKLLFHHLKCFLYIYSSLPNLFFFLTFPP